MLRGLRGLVGPLVLVASAIFRHVAPEVIQATADAAVRVVEGIGVILTATGIIKKTRAELAK